jgi:predicted NAD/FAD-dependent oxidoreductase
MNAPVRAMASACDVRWNTAIDTLSHDGEWRFGDELFDTAIVAVPAEQVAPLIAAHDITLANAARSAISEPCWTVMVAFDGPAPINRDRLTDIGIIGSAVRNSAKPGRTGPEAWVLQASGEWSCAHLQDDPAKIERALLAAFADHIKVRLPAVIATSVHRWRYAKVGALARGAIWNSDIQLGACGDWLLGPRIEAAWLSGQQLAALLESANWSVSNNVSDSETHNRPLAACFPLPNF